MNLREITKPEPTITEKYGLKGSEELVKSLPYSAIKLMAEHFGVSTIIIGKVISGKREGKTEATAALYQKYLQCANQLAKEGQAHKKNIKSIINKYES